MITTTTGKRRRQAKQAPTQRAMRPFRAPRRRSVIPGLLVQTRTEKKVLYIGSTDPTSPNLAFNTTGNIQCINLIQVGSSMFNRIGRKIEMRSVRLNMHIGTLPVTRATITPDFVKIAIVYDRQTNGANPAITDVFQDTDQAGANTTDSQSGINMNNRERFVTILEKKITIPQATNTAGVLTNVFPNDVNLPIKFDEFRKLKGLTTHYGADSNPAVIGDVRTGGLFLVSFSTLQASGTEILTGFWNLRLKYTDA